MPKGTPTAVRATVAKRRTDAIDMRRAGVDPLTIGRSLRYGKWTGEGDDAVQISSDASITRMVRQDISRGLADRREGLETAADKMRQEATERLERLRAGLWAKATRGDIGAARECRAIEAELRQLWQYGVKPVVGVDVGAASAQVESVVAELFTLLSQSAEGAPLSPALEA